MKICKNCNSEFPIWITIDGKKRNLKSRKFCLDCTPFGTHNTKDITAGVSNYEITGKKFCKKCKLDQPLEYFYTRKSNGRPSGWCKACLCKARVMRQRTLKLLAIEYKGGKCVACGYSGPPAAFDFHHLDRAEKEFKISRRSGKVLSESIKNELDKCDLLCAICHRLEHAGHSKYD